MMKKITARWVSWIACGGWLTIVTLGLAGCGPSPAEKQLVGRITIDGSSTVQPISNAIRETFIQLHPGVEIIVSGNGTGNGFASFYDKGVDIADASRPIKLGEFEKCRANGVGFIEIPVAYDGLTIVIHPKNDWAGELTLEQLSQIFVGDDPAMRWSDVDPSWPDQEIKIFAPGTGSGSYDYFHEVIAGPNDEELRSDMNLNEDDNILVQGVAGNQYSIGFFGVAYYVENQDKLQAVAVVNPQDQVAYLPTAENIASSDYAPFSRPLFIYVNTESLDRAEVETFVQYYLENAAAASEAVGYVRLPSSVYVDAQENLDGRVVGTHYVTEEGEHRSGALETLFVKENLVQ